MRNTRIIKNKRAGSSARVAGVAIALGFSSFAGSVPPVHSQDAAPCATAETLSQASGSNALVAGSSEKIVIAIRPDKPRVGRPVIAWIVGHQPGHLLVARQISWKFNNAASMLKGGGGGSSSTVYLTPGLKKISVAVTDMKGTRSKATCSFNVTW